MSLVPFREGVSDIANLLFLLQAAWSTVERLYVQAVFLCHRELEYGYCHWRVEEYLQLEMVVRIAKCLFAK